MTQRITAIIPAKALSNRLPNKNTLPFGESNLLIHKIRQLKQVDAIKEMNEVSGEQIKQGDRLLIFKENMSIL